MKWQENAVRAATGKLRARGAEDLAELVLEAALGEDACPPLPVAHEALGRTLYDAARVLGEERTKAALAAKE
jgi:hypothetical protein